jgi:uncharacterized protein (TIGR02996 family)
VAKSDPWLERAAGRAERDLTDLFATLNGESRPATERRLTALVDWPRSEQVATHAAALLRAFPFDSWALGGATIALGLAIVHGASVSAYEHTKLSRLSMELERWRKVALVAARRFAFPTKRDARQDEAPLCLEPLPEKPKALHAAWVKLAGSRAPAALPTLLASLPRGAPADVALRATELLEFEPDARIADALCELLEYPPVTAHARNPFFLALGLGVVVHGDGRHGPVLERVARGELSSLFWLRRLLDDRRPVPILAPPAPQPASASPRDEASFVAWIAEAPDDLARRHVFADWLSERGDPRGELMALQLSSSGAEATAARIATLLKRHQKTWLGSIARSVKKWSEPVFADGMLSEVHLSLENSVPKPTDPLLAGLRKLVVRGRDDALAKKFMASPLLSSLRELRAPPALVAVLDPAARARLQTLWVRVGSRQELDLLASLELPSLRRLVLDQGTTEDDGAGFHAQPEEVVGLRALAGLEELEVGPSLAPGAWLAACRGTRIRSLRVTAPHAVTYHLTLRAAPAASAEASPALHVTVGRPEYVYGNEYERVLVGPLRTFEGALLTRATLELEEDGLLDESLRAAIEALGVSVQVKPS